MTWYMNIYFIMLAEYHLHSYLLCSSMYVISVGSILCIGCFFLIHWCIGGKEDDIDLH